MTLYAALAVTIGVREWRHPKRRARRMLARATEKPLGAIADGECVRVRGVALRCEPTIGAPFSGRRCMGFRATVEMLVEGDWKEVLVHEWCGPFTLAAEGVEALVDGPFVFGLEVDARTEGEHETAPAVLEAMRRLGVDMAGALARPRRLRFREAVLEPNDPVWVLGRASVVADPDGRRESLRGEPVKRVISGSKREPVVLADEDEPGVLDRFG
jgi:hypothetical protein